MVNTEDVPQTYDQQNAVFPCWRHCSCRICEHSGLRVLCTMSYCHKKNKYTWEGGEPWTTWLDSYMYIIYI